MGNSVNYRFWKMRTSHLIILEVPGTKSNGKEIPGKKLLRNFYSNGKTMVPSPVPFVCLFVCLLIVKLMKFS